MLQDFEVYWIVLDGFIGQFICRSFFDSCTFWVFVVLQPICWCGHFVHVSINHWCIEPNKEADVVSLLQGILSPTQVPILILFRSGNWKTLSSDSMACNPSNCQSNCYGNEEKAEVAVGEEYVSANQNQNLCIKCKTKEPIGGDEGRMFCIECFRSNLYGKFRLAVTSHAMITPTDNVLVAFSGGPSSRSPSPSFQNSKLMVHLDAIISREWFGF